jgi:hypothetical protein
LEQGTTVTDFDDPRFEHGSELRLPEQRVQGDDREDSDVDDWKIASIMDDLAALYKQPGESEWGHSHSLDDFEDASAARTGCEQDIVQGIYDQMRVSDQWTRYEVCDLGLLTPETSSGNNPEYLYAKLLWWKQYHSIQGLEAIIRHQLEQVRGLRSPELRRSKMRWP